MGSAIAIQKLAPALQPYAKLIDSNKNGKIDQSDVPAIQAKLADKTQSVATQKAMTQLLAVAANAGPIPSPKASSAPSPTLVNLGNCENQAKTLSTQLGAQQTQLATDTATMTNAPAVVTAQTALNNAQAALSQYESATQAQKYNKVGSPENNQLNILKGNVTTAQNALTAAQAPFQTAIANDNTAISGTQAAIAANNNQINTYIQALVGPQINPLQAQINAWNTTTSDLASNSQVLANASNKLIWDNTSCWTNPESSYDSLLTNLSATSKALTDAQSTIASTAAPTPLQQIAVTLPPFITWQQVMAQAGISSVAQLTTQGNLPPSDAAIAQQISNLQANLATAQTKLQTDQNQLQTDQSSGPDGGPNSSAIAVDSANINADQANIQSINTNIAAEQAAIQSDWNYAAGLAQQFRNNVTNAITAITFAVINQANAGKSVIASDTATLTTDAANNQNQIETITNNLIQQALQAASK